MKGFFSKLKKNKKGYTLTELIVVVAILGVLAVIAVPMVLNAVGDARENADKTSAKAIETAVQLCLVDGTLKMSKSAADDDIITDSTGKQDGVTMGDAIAKKLTGETLPTSAKDSTQKWKLIIKNGQVEAALKDAKPLADTYVILGVK